MKKAISMKKMCIRILLMITAAAMMLSFAACSNSGGNSGESSGSANNKDEIVVGFSQVGAESEWRKANTADVQAAADANERIKLIFSDAQQKQENQITAIRNFINQGVDVIAIAPTVETGWETVLGEAKDAGIPVILVDRMISGSNVDDLYTTWIGADFETEGKNAAKWLEDYLKEEDMSSSEINIALLQGTTGSSAQVGRTKGFEAIAATHDNWEIIEKQSGNFTRSEGKEVMEAFMKSSGDKINVLISENDDMAMGAIQAIEEAGKKPGEDIIIISYDAIKDAFQAIINGQLNCTVECNPLSGELIMQAACDIIDGKKIEKTVYVEESIFDAKNAAQIIDSRTY